MLPTPLRKPPLADACSGAGADVEPVSFYALL
jgi:hypothetical protein